MGGGSYLTNRNINNNLALKKQQEVDPIQAAINGTSFSAPTAGSAAYNMLQQKNSNDARAAYIASQNTPTLDNTLTPMAVEAPVATVEPTPIMSTTRTTDGLFGNFTPTAAAPTVDINKVIATNKYGGALKYSELSPEDQAVVDARRASGVDVSPNAYKGATALMGDVSYGVGEQYSTPEEALNALPSYFGGLAERRVGTDEKFNTKNFDPSEFTMAGVSPVGGVSGRAAKESAVDYLTKNNVPVSKEVDGETRYLTTGLGDDVLYATVEKGTLPKGGGSFEARGPVGTYSTIHVKPESPLDDPVLSVLGAFLPPIALATTAMKAIAGETLHAGDWLKLTTAGLEQAGTITPPSTGAGGMGPIDNGVGLFGTTYDQTKNVMEAAAAAGSGGNPAEILIKGFGVTDNVLDSIGLDEAAFDNSIVDYTGFVEGVEQAASQVAGGDSVEDALKGGLLDYINESEGTLDLGIVTDAIDAVGGFIDDNIFQPIINTIGDIDLGDFEDTVKDLGREFDDNVLQEIKGGIEDFAPQVEDFVKGVGGGVIDVVETVGGAAVDAVETVGGEVIDVVEAVGGNVVDFVETVGGTVIDTVETVGGGIVTVVETASGEIVNVVEKVGGEVIDALEPIGTAITDIAKVTGQTVEDVLEGVGDIAGELSDEIGDAIKAGGDALEDFITPIGETIEDIAKATGSTVEDVLKGVASVGGEIIDEVGEVGQDVIDALGPLGDTLEDIAKATGSTVEDVLKGVADLTGVVGSELEDVIRATGSGLEDFIRPIGSAVEDIAKTTGRTVGDVLEGVADLTGELGSGLEDAIRAGGSQLEDFIRPIGSTIEDIARTTGSTVEDVLKGVAGVGEDIIGEIGDVGQDVIDALGPLGSTIEDFARATGSTLEDVLKDIGGLGEDILGGVADVGGEVIDAVKASGLSTEGMLQSGFAGLSAQQAAEADSARRLAVATRTTDSLFSEFKGFKTEIGDTPQELVQLIQRNRR